TGGDSGPPIVPGKPEASLMMKAVSYTDRDLKMPPDRKLEPADISTLREWIVLGAPDPRTGTPLAAKPAITAAMAAATTHWAYQLPQRTAPPAVKDSAWPRNDIDRYVLAKLEAKGLRPAPDAPPETLIRRLAYDLTGLPTLKDCGLAIVDGHSTSVDALLGSNAFAERWAQHWLDAARFAESSGGGRTLPFKDAWRYRDYVIESIRNDVPVDRFITEQLAGDLLPFDSAAQRARQLVATGFLVLGANNYEEQDKDLLRMDIVDEQLDVIGKSLLGLSIGCARCHDHKFDPIPTRDYYAMAGILRSTKLIRNTKENVAHWIDTPLPLEGAAETAAKAQDARSADLKERLETATAALKKFGVSKVPKSERSLPLDKVPGIVVDETEAKKVGEWKTSTSVPPYIGAGYVHDINEGKGTKTLTFSPRIPRTARYEVRFAYTALQDRCASVPVKILHADGEEEIKVDEQQPPPIANHYVSLGKFRFEADGQGFVLISNEGTKGVVTADAVVFIPEDELAKVTEAEGVPVSQNPKMARAEKKVKDLTQELKELEKSGPPRPEAMTVAEHEDLGDSPIHIRGQIRNLGPTVPRGYIQAAFHGEVPKVPAGQSGRVQLAQWITSPGNTLTARVLANRVWMELFGEGLVRTPDNFGVTGEKPSHPELLDHLAFKLMDGGWSLKKLVSYIVSSHAYAMASRAEGPGLATDPENRLLWRQNRKRMDADALRDTILATAGTLDLAFMGSNIRNVKAVDGNDGGAGNVEYNYVYTDTRRSVYTPAFRNKRLELFEAFDFGNNNQPLAQRNTSTVAPQALYFMNHEFVMQQSQEAAKRLLAMTFDSEARRLDHAFAMTLGRPPTAKERRLAQDFVTVSDSEAEAAAVKAERWALLVQSLFASVDFRHVE
ncbi:MAG: Protein of unknown function (DUF1553)/Protein of unknown function (DUF1549)/Planctomycete, partial [Verrucomicrobiaceae bacterium]|nr:Protein of unknown function (DUF1553)/Protein of unknown function (DUF1549)/Planctomycete [Verrucomicrobiaceae bacterium]